jgi:hypothetical protein
MGWCRSARNNWRKFLGLSPAERHLFLAATLLLPAVALALRLVGLRRCQAVLTRLAPKGRSAAPPGRAAAAARMVLAASRHAPCRADCLRRALVLWWLLRRAGLPGELRLGVRKRDGQLEAHAWVEHGGRPLEDCADEHPFVPFAGPLSLPLPRGS